MLRRKCKTQDMRRAVEIAESVENGKERSYAIAVPIYDFPEMDGELDTYLGLNVWRTLSEASDEFNFVPVGVHGFKDSSEITCAEESIREKIVYIVHPVYMSSDMHRAVAINCLDAIKGTAEADRVYLIEPYNRDLRQDVTHGRVNLTVRTTADAYVGAGLDRCIVFDPHFRQFPVAFPTRHRPICIELTRFVKEFMEGRIDREDTVIVAADKGAVDRVEALANQLGCEMAYIHQKRSRTKPDEKEVVAIIGDFQGKHALIRDDVIGSGGTTVNAAHALMSRGARKVSVFASFLDYCDDAARRLKEAGIDVYGTDAVPLRGKLPEELLPEYEGRIMPISPIIANIIQIHSKRGSLSQYYEYSTNGE